jgi:N-acetylglucosaminyl-diphospho-decaprenol L-rhamnosyltransferase
MGSASDNPVNISISVVSHSQLGMVTALMDDLKEHCGASCFELILTFNLPENVSFAGDDFVYPIKLIRNTSPQGFATNHNKALTFASGKCFCVLNPDIRLNVDPFPALLASLSNPAVGVVAPLIMNGAGAVEVSARRLPSPLKILSKFFGFGHGPDYLIEDTPIHPDWVAGMFMLFRRTTFEKMHGFDERYFLYYEDVELCARLKLSGYRVVLVPQAKVVHNAQRSSHHNLKYLGWHLRSMLRFFLSPVYRQVHRR